MRSQVVARFRERLTANFTKPFIANLLDPDSIVLYSIEWRQKVACSHILAPSCRYSVLVRNLAFTFS